MLWDFILTFSLNWFVGMATAPSIEEAQPQPQYFMHMHIGDKMSELEPYAIKTLNASEHWQNFPYNKTYYEVQMPNNNQGYYLVEFDANYAIASIREDWQWSKDRLVYIKAAKEKQEQERREKAQQDVMDGYTAINVQWQTMMAAKMNAKTSVEGQDFDKLVDDQHANGH